MTASSPTSCSRAPGDIPTLETVAAAALLREHLPQLRVRVINVVDLMRLQPESEHPHGLPDHEFDALFTASQHVIFAYHGYPSLIHRLTYRRTNHANFHVRGYKEEGTTTTPFDMVMLNDLDRFHLVMDVIDRVPGLGERAAGLRQQMQDARLHARAYTREFGEDPPEVRDWTWTGAPPAAGARGQLTQAPVAILAVNAGSSSLKLSLIADDDRILAERELEAPGAQVDPEQLDAALSDGLDQAEAVVHRIVHGGERFTGPVLIDDEVTRRARAADRPRPAAPAEIVGGAARGLRAAPGRAGDRLLRHRLSSDAVAGGEDLSTPGPLARALGPAQVRLSRPVARLDRAADSGAVSGAAGYGADRLLPPGRRRLAVRDLRRSLGRHDDGVHPARRTGDGDPFGQRRPGDAVVAAGARAADPSTSCRSRWSTSPVSPGSPGPATCGRSSRRAGEGDDTARLALDVYMHRLRSLIAGMAAAMAGIDVLAFTGGVGEHSAEVRSLAVDGLGFLGIELDADRNAQVAPDAEIGAARGAGPDARADRA